MAFEGSLREAGAGHPAICHERAASGLADAAPHLSARGLIPAPHWPGRVLALAGLFGLLAPPLVLSGIGVLGMLAFASLIAWRAFLVLVGLADGRRRNAAPRHEASLPSYTLMVPAYREAAAMPALARALCELDYPTDRLEVLILLEAGDTATLAAARRQAWPGEARLLVLPPGHPRTKPRALNYGLQVARGALVAVFDAEDRPHPGQLRAAAARFGAAPAGLACVQAPLRAHNAGESWLAAQWALEYAVQFRLLLPALARLGLPIPLGGTSNHFRTNSLREVGGWDAWNVTEDADLGIRLARFGYRIAVIDPPTLEEAPETLDVWTAQRSRWIKGHMQSWWVLMRRPRAALAELGPAGFLAVQMTLGGSILSALVHAPVALWCLLCAFSPHFALGTAGGALLAAGLAVNVSAALAAPGRFAPGRLVAALTLPIYWPLLGLAATRAVAGLLLSPHYWAKTPHGQTRAVPDPTLAAFAE